MILLRQNGYKPALVVHFVIDPKLLLRRITGRRMCKVGGEIYNIYERPPKSDLRCDNDGGQLEQRPEVREELAGPGCWRLEGRTGPRVRNSARLGSCRER